MIKRSFPAMGIVWIFLLLLNLLAWCSRSFSDWYAGTVFPVFSGFWSGITGRLPFSLGEWLIAAGIVLGVLGILSFPVCMCFSFRKRAAVLYGAFYGWILTWLFTVLTLHFFILYQCTPFREKFFPKAPEAYSDAEVSQVLNFLIVQANTLSGEVPRDEEGHFVLTEDLQEGAQAAMAGLGEIYPQFSGKYPCAKPIYHSYFFSQQYLLGIYFPFSMEANYNPDACPVNLPNTVCHELIHLKGNIFEDEAEFLAYLACRESDSPQFRYSGYISALEYMLNLEGYASETEKLLPEVRADLYRFVPDGYWEEKADEALVPEEILSSDTIQEAADFVIDQNLKANGISEGKKSYSGMVRLLLDEYFAREMAE